MPALPQSGELRRLLKALRMSVSSRQYFAHSVKLLAGCVTRAGRQTFARNLRSLSLPPIGRIGYQQWIADRLRLRGPLYPLRPTRGTFSFLTTVYDTKGRYVLELFESVKAQTAGDFEWVLLDNGSTRPDTLAAIAELRRDPRVVYARVERNLGIIGGIAHCLHRATGRYVLPLDSDDLLYPDALQILAHAIAQHDEPPLLFTDEDKVREQPTPFDAYHKPDWDPVLFWNSCYIAHLCAIRRDLALQLGIYSDDDARGCHDWDTFFRFLRAGHTPLHVPEVVYSWRLHPQSCAGNIFSKSYIHESHRHVLGSNLAALPGAGNFELVQSPLFVDTPDWWVRRRHQQPRPLTALWVGPRGDAPPEWLRTHPLVRATEAVPPERLSDLVAPLARLRAHDPRGDGLVLVVYAGTRPIGEEWPWEAMGLCERFPDTAVVGGRLLDSAGKVWSAGEVIGFEGLLGAPDRGRMAADPGYFAWQRKQRSASAVHAAFCLVRSDFLTEFAAQSAPASAGFLGGWLAAHAAARGRRVVFSPLVQAIVPPHLPVSEAVADAEARAFVARHPRFLGGERYYATHLGLDAFDAHAAVPPAERERALRGHLQRLAITPPPRLTDVPATAS